jgi:hypothetical protein
MLSFTSNNRYFNENPQGGSQEIGSTNDSTIIFAAFGASLLQRSKQKLCLIREPG